MNPNDIMKLTENFYEGFSEEDIAEIEKIILDRSNSISEERTKRLQKILEDVTEENLHDAIEFGKSVREK